MTKLSNEQNIFYPKKNRLKENFYSAKSMMKPLTISSKPLEFFLFSLTQFIIDTTHSIVDEFLPLVFSVATRILSLHMWLFIIDIIHGIVNELILLVFSSNHENCSSSHVIVHCRHHTWYCRWINYVGIL